MIVKINSYISFISKPPFAATTQTFHIYPQKIATSGNMNVTDVSSDCLWKSYKSGI